MSPILPASDAALLGRLLEMVDLDEPQDVKRLERRLGDLCRLVGAEVLYTVIPQDGGWLKTGVGPDGQIRFSTLAHLSGIVRHVLSRRSRFLVTRLSSGNHFNRHQDGWSGHETTSFIAVPIHRRGILWGVLVLLRSADHPPFDEGDLLRADLIADAVAVREANRERLVELQNMARLDTTTLLPNSRDMRRTVDRTILRSEQSEEPFSLILVEADVHGSFEGPNGEAPGPVEAAGQLGRLARLLERSIRSADTVAYIGGTGFAILMPRTDREGSVVAIARLEQQIIAKGPAHGVGRVACRFGLACFPEDGVEWTGLVKAASLALMRGPVARIAIQEGNGVGGARKAA